MEYPSRNRNSYILVQDKKGRRKQYKERAEKYLGEVRYSNSGEKMWLLRYINCNNITVYFPDSKVIVSEITYDNFINGRVKNPYTPTKFKGYIGKGKYSSIDENGKMTPTYRAWLHMLERCYSPLYQEKKPTYIGCEVYNKWLNFQNFAPWYEKNFYQIEGAIMCLDKDILVKGNKIYSPETCIIVPNYINTLFAKSKQGHKGLIGTGKCSNGKFKAMCKGKHIGTYETEIEAFKAYKEYKENLIKSVADQFKDKIPTRLYTAMYSYKVEATD